MIHELLKNPSSEDDRTRAEARVLEYVDWGSQSIAQSKFQRTAPSDGKDFQEDIWIFVRQYFSRKFPKKVLGMNVRLLVLRAPHSHLSQACRPKGRRKMQTAFSLSRPFY